MREMKTISAQALLGGEGKGSTESEDPPVWVSGYLNAGYPANYVN